MECDVLIKGGEVIDPSQGLRGVRDVLVTGDRIAGVVEAAAEVTAKHTIDARGLLVVPGLCPAAELPDVVQARVAKLLQQCRERARVAGMRIVLDQIDRRSDQVQVVQEEV